MKISRTQSKKYGACGVSTASYKKNKKSLETNNSFNQTVYGANCSKKKGLVCKKLTKLGRRRYKKKFPKGHQCYTGCCKSKKFSLNFKKVPDKDISQSSNYYN